MTGLAMLVGASLACAAPGPLSAFVHPAVTGALAVAGWWAAGLRCMAAILGFALAMSAMEDIRSGWLSDPLAGSDLLLRVRIADVPSTDAHRTRFSALLERNPQITGLPERVRLSWYGEHPPLVAGSRWLLKVRLRPPSGGLAPGAFDYEKWLFQRRFQATGYVRQSALNRPLAEGYVLSIHRWRQYLAERIDTILPAASSTGVIKAVSLGIRDDLDTRQRAQFQHTGTSHLMAISGLHVGMVAILGWWLGRALGRVRGGGQAERWGLALSTGLAAGYAALAGFSLPTCRALTMLILLTGLRWRRRRLAARCFLDRVLMVLVLLDPLAPLDMGFWLSMGAAAFLVTSAVVLRPSARESRSTHRGTRPSRWALDLCRTQWRLGIIMILPGLAVFGVVSGLAMPANLVAIPLFGFAVVPLSLSGVLLAACGGHIAEWPLRFAAGLVEALLRFLSWLSDAQFLVLQLPEIPGAGLLIAGTGALTLLGAANRYSFGVGTLLLLLVLSSRPPPPGPGALEVWIMDVGQGLAVLVRTHRSVLLYDTGPAFGTSNAGERIVVPMLRAQGIRRIDVLILSHDDSDHTGGEASVSAAFRPALVMASFPATGQDPGRQACRNGMSWVWDGVVFRILHPDLEALPGDNNRSCVLSIEAAGFGVLIPGDIERRAEARILSALKPVDLVIAPHHGSLTSSSPALVRLTRPRWVAFATGRGNRWGFPREEVLRRWRSAGACALTVHATGTLRFRFGPGSFGQLVTAGRNRARPWRYPAPRPLCGPAL